MVLFVAVTVVIGAVIAGVALYLTYRSTSDGEYFCILHTFFLLFFFAVFFPLPYKFIHLVLRVDSLLVLQNLDRKIICRYIKC